MHKPENSLNRSRRRWAVGVIGLTMLAMGCDRHNNPLTDLNDTFFPRPPLDYARDAFNTYDADKRRVAINVLSAAPFGGEEAYVRMYRLLIDDPDGTVRAACVKSLGMHGSEEDAKLIIPRLSDPLPAVRWEAAKALQKIHSQSAVTPLITATSKDEDADVRMAAAFALGQYPQPSVFNALVGALDDTDFAVVEVARDSLHTLTGYDMGTDGALWLLWAAKHPNEKLFEKQQQYTWQPFNKPRGFWDKAKFWTPAPEPLPPQIPKGMEIVSGTPEEPKS